MAVREIKTSIALDGEQQFKQALADASRNMRVMSADLRTAETEFKATGDAQQYYADKSRLLREQIAQQEQVVDALVNAVRQSAQIYGDNSAKTDAWRIKLSNATAKLFQMKKSLSDTNREAEEFGRDSRRVGRQIEDGIGDGAEEASRSVKDLIESLQQDVGSIKGSMAFQVASTVTQGIVNVVQSVGDFVDSNRDYRRAMAQFEQAAKAGGYNKDAMQDMLFSLAAFTGDFDGAKEAVSNLMRVGLDEQWMGTAADLFSYASMVFQDTLKLENLSESFQETVATGKPTGAFGEFVERMGGNLDELTKVMEDADTAEERAQAALTYAAPKGYKDTLDEYNERNASLQEAEKAQLELNNAWAELAEQMEPLTTEITKEMTEVVKLLSDAMTDLMPMLEGIIENIGAAAKKAVEVISDFKELGFGALFMGHAGESDEEAKDAVEASLNAMPSEKEMKQYLSKSQAEAVKAAGEEDGQAYADAFGTAAADALDADTLEMALENLQAAWTLGGEEEAQKRLEQMGFTAEQKQQLIDEMGKLGLDMSSSLDTSMTEGLSGAASNANTSGQNVGTQLANGLAFGLSSAYNTAVEYVNAINSLLSGLGGDPTFGLSAGGYYNGLGGGTSRINVTVPLSINGREVARAALSDINSMQGARTSRASRLGK